MDSYQEIIQNLQKQNEEIYSYIQKLEKYKDDNTIFNIRELEIKEENLKEKLMELRYYFEMLKENKANQILVPHKYLRIFSGYFLATSFANIYLSLLEKNINKFVSGEALALILSFILSIGLSELKIMTIKNQFKKDGIQPILSDIQGLENESKENYLKILSLEQENNSYDEQIKKLNNQVLANNIKISLIEDAMLEAENHKNICVEEQLNRIGFEVDHDKKVLNLRKEV